MPDVIIAFWSWFLCWQQDFGVPRDGKTFLEEATSGLEDAFDVLVDVNWDEDQFL